MSDGAYVALTTSNIYDWATFHAESRRALGFPADTEPSLEAWTLCLSSLRDDPGLTSVRLPPGEMLQLEIPDAEGLVERVPDLMEAVALCASVANRRYLERGQAPAIALILS